MPESLDTRPLEEFYASLEATGLVRRLFEIARDEDLSDAVDITGRAWFENDEPMVADVSFRQAGTVAGLACVPMICEIFESTLGARVEHEVAHADGSRVADGTVVATLRGPRSAVVGVERTVLNTVGRLSGIATHTAKYVHEVKSANPNVRLLDTRKTTPGLRMLEKYAVRCGGGWSHRMGLSDAMLLKDNHIAGLGDDELRARLERASERARELGARFVEVEVDHLSQLDAVLQLEPGVVDIVLLDNMPYGQLGHAVQKRDAANKELLLEASGGVRLETVAGIASTGVDRISVGALTHSSISLDVGVDARPAGD